MPSALRNKEREGEREWHRRTDVSIHVVLLPPSDLNTANDKLITRDEAFAYIEKFEAMRDFNPGGITLFTHYNREDRP